MTYSNRGGNSFGGGNYPKRSFNDRGSDRSFGGSGDREMFDAICAQCGTACKVPFRPNGRKEVFCSKCFETNGGGSRESSFSSRPAYGNAKPLFRATCDQCGEQCEVPFRPTNGKPVLCSNCFAGKEDRNPRSFVNQASTSKAQDMETINAKLDKILKLLSPAKEATKEITTKILEEIEQTSGKKIEKLTKRAKTVSKKKAE